MFKKILVTSTLALTFLSGSAVFANTEAPDTPVVHEAVLFSTSVAEEQPTDAVLYSTTSVDSKAPASTEVLNDKGEAVGQTRSLVPTDVVNDKGEVVGQTRGAATPEGAQTLSTTSAVTTTSAKGDAEVPEGAVAKGEVTTQNEVAPISAPIESNQSDFNLSNLQFYSFVAAALLVGFLFGFFIRKKA